MNDIERIDYLIGKANDVLATHQSPPPGVIGFPTLNHGAFTEWQTQTINFIRAILPPDSPYIKSFEKEVKQGYKSAVAAGIGILKAVKEDIESGFCSKVEPQNNPLKPIRSFI